MPETKQAIKDRQVTTYPPKKYKELLDAYSEQNEMTASKAAALAIKYFFDTMPADKRLRLLQSATC